MADGTAVIIFIIIVVVMTIVYTAIMQLNEVNDAVTGTKSISKEEYKKRQERRRNHVPSQLISDEIEIMENNFGFIKNNYPETSYFVERCENVYYQTNRMETLTEEYKEFQYAEQLKSDLNCARINVFSETIDYIKQIIEEYKSGKRILKHQPKINVDNCIEKCEKALERYKQLKNTSSV